MTKQDDQTVVNRSTYDRIAARYLERACRRPTDTGGFSDFQQAFISALPARATVADVGCGPALDSARFGDLGFRIVGLDLSFGMLSIAAERLSGRVAQADLRRLPVGPGLLDAIWCSACLLHVPEADTEIVLGELRTILRPSGCLGLITAIGRGSVFEPVPYAAGEVRWFVYRNRARLEHQLRRHGFTVTLADELAGDRHWFMVLAQAT